MGNPAKQEDKKYTYSDYLKWNEYEKVEMIEGVAYAMAAAPSRIHQEVLGEIFNQIKNFLREKNCKVYTAPFAVRLPAAEESDEEISTVVEPDISVICDLAKLDDRGCKGSPDWIIEIISPSTASLDYIKKLLLYEKNGVKEYWIVHPTDKITMVYELNPEGYYTRPEIYAVEDNVKVRSIEGLLIDLSEVFKE